MASIHPKIELPLPTEGLRPDLDDFHVPPSALRSTSYNWLLRNGKLSTRPGLTEFGQDVGTDVPLGIVSFFTGLGVRHQVFASQQRWWAYDTNTDAWVDISNPAHPWSGNVAIPVNFRVFNLAGISHLLGVNGVDPPLAWNTNPPAIGTQVQPFGGSPPVARCIAIVNDRVILGHFVGGIGPNGVDVSAFQDYTSGWGVTQSTVLVETPGFIVAMQELASNRTAIYKTDSIYVASATGGLAPIRFDIQKSEISGPLNSATVVPLDNSVHAVFARDHHLYFYDGINYTRHPASDRIRVLYEKNATTDITGRLRTHAHYNHTHNELWWFYTRTGLESIGPRDAIILNMNNNSVWKVDFTKAAFSFTASHFGGVNISGTTRERAFLGNSVGRIFLSEGSLDLTLSLDVLMETGMSSLGEPTLVKTIEETEHYFASPASTQSPTVSLITSESGENPTVSDSQAITITSTSPGPYSIGHRNPGGERVTSRFVGIRIEDDTLEDPLEYRGSSVTAIPRGRR